MQADDASFLGEPLNAADVILEIVSDLVEHHISSTDSDLYLITVIPPDDVDAELVDWCIEVLDSFGSNDIDCVTLIS